MNRTDQVADALRHKDAEQRGTTVLLWGQITDGEKSKWRALALVAAAEFAKPHAGTLARTSDRAGERAAVELCRQVAYLEQQLADPARAHDHPYLRDTLHHKRRELAKRTRTPELAA